jgi:outer membrane receptor protein involved in Fe transport
VRSDTGKKPLIIVDGTITEIDLKTIDPENIKSVTVLTDKTATDKYGEKAKDGALEIITKTGPVDLQSKNLLYVVDGVIKDDISLIDPNSIESISVMKGDAAELYGVKGKDGVIAITLKKNVSVNPVIKTSEKVNVVNDVSVEKVVPVKK